MRKTDEEKYAQAMAFWRQLGLNSADELLKTGIVHNKFYKSEFKELDISLSRHHPMIYARTVGEFGRPQRLDLSLLNPRTNIKKIEELANFLETLRTEKPTVPMLIGYGTFNPRGAPTIEYFKCGPREDLFVSHYMDTKT